MGERTSVAYDAEMDAEKLSVPMKKWARMGFLRGFAGVRGEVLPKGKMSLPSAAFHEAATRGLQDIGNPDEFERRHVYISAVESKLREVQAEAISDHFRKAALGRAADFALGFMVIALTAGLIVRLGAFHPLTFVFLILFAAKLLFMHLSVRGMLNAANAAFKTQASEVRLPWAGFTET